MCLQRVIRGQFFETYVAPHCFNTAVGSGMLIARRPQSETFCTHCTFVSKMKQFSKVNYVLE